MEKATSWWKDYRRERFKQRERLNFESIVYKSASECVKKYNANSSLSTLYQLNNYTARLPERLLHSTTFFLAVSILWLSLGYIWGNLDQPLVVSMDTTTYPIANIDFPAVALCSTNLLSKEYIGFVASIMYEEIQENSSFSGNAALSPEYCEWAVTQTGRLLDFEYEQTISDNISMYPYDFFYEWEKDYMKFMAPSCSDMLLSCSWKGKRVECDSLFSARRTTRGYCCTFNYVSTFDQEDAEDQIVDNVIQHQEVQGIRHGLQVLLDPMLEDYGYYVGPRRGFDVFLFDPMQFPDMRGGSRNVHRILEPNMASFIQLQSVKQVAADELRKYSLVTRNCRFSDELPEGYDSDIYSTSDCLVRCRARALHTLCRCTPYFMPNTTSSYRICNLEDLQCLNKYREKLNYLFPRGAASTSGLQQELQNSLTCAECYPDCEFTMHRTRAARLPISEAGRKIKHLNGDNLTGLCYLAVYQPTNDGALVVVDVVSYWYELMSSIGGLCGALLGISAITVIELLYYVFFQFNTSLYKNYRAYYY